MGIRIDTEKFIERALKVHKDRYDYSKVVCEGWNSIVEIICKDHGVFKQSAKSHCNGNGCKKCSSRKKTAKKFIDKAKIVHGNKYDYSKVRYKNSTLPVDIICKVHGTFSQRANTHTFLVLVVLNVSGETKVLKITYNKPEKFMDKHTVMKK